MIDVNLMAYWVEGWVLWGPKEQNSSDVNFSKFIHRQTTLWVWGRVTSVIWYASQTLTLFVICNGWSW